MSAAQHTQRQRGAYSKSVIPKGLKGGFLVESYVHAAPGSNAEKNDTEIWTQYWLLTLPLRVVMTYSKVWSVSVFSKRRLSIKM